MTVITQLDTSSPDAPQAQIAPALRRVAADAAVLRLKVQAARWHHAGPERRELADLLVEREGELTHLLNSVAGRLLALGYKVPPSMAAYRAETALSPDPSDGGPAQSLAELSEDLGRVISGCRAAHAAAAAIDSHTAGRLAAQICALERGAWMLSAQASRDPAR